MFLINVNPYKEIIRYFCLVLPQMCVKKLFFRLVYTYCDRLEPAGGVIVANKKTGLTTFQSPSNCTPEMRHCRSKLPSDKLL